VAIWYIFTRFGIINDEKSGNPGAKWKQLWRIYNRQLVGPFLSNWPSRKLSFFGLYLFRQMKKFPSPFSTLTTSPFNRCFLNVFTGKQGDQMGEISPVGDCLVWRVFWKLQKQPKIFGPFFCGKSNFFILIKNVLGYISGEFFTKLISSPCW
jgi:hypothetical protein